MGALIPLLEEDSSGLGTAASTIRLRARMGRGSGKGLQGPQGVSPQLEEGVLTLQAVHPEDAYRAGAEATAALKRVHRALQ